ncbi:hypothetical protein GF377_08755 [candidate division GN15 bacterium]|nr:hypothetical protein [candidate division GN15 bacterium]
MASGKKKQEKGIVLPKKTYWHLYSLQTLQSQKLADVINKVLKREYVLIK